MKKKILCILHLPPPVHGAAKIGQLIRQSKLINDAFDAYYINLSTSRNLSNIGRGGLTKVFVLIAIYFRILYAILTNRFDLCYLTINARGLGYYKEMLLVSLLKIFNYKCIYHFHNKGINNHHNSWISDKLYRYQFKNSAAILISPLLYTDVEHYLPEEKVFYCTNGIPSVLDKDLDKINDQRRRKKVPEILFLSNLMKEKGVFTLLDSCRLLNSRKVNFNLVLIGAWGDINPKELFEYIKSHGLSDKVKFAGSKYDKEKAEYFERADLFIHPTLNDCLPLVVLEAMQYGLPIISTEEGAISDAVHNTINGFLVPKNNPEALADRIHYLLNNPDIRREMGKNGRKRFEEYYTIEEFEKNFISTLNRISDEFNT
jgi:glycosyltransferase involved in cell wall biosynthesis